MDTDLFKSWLKDHLLKYAVGGRPILLVLDGHSTHYQPELIKYAKENQVILLCLPPHTTHESQPLDANWSLNICFNRCYLMINMLPYDDDDHDDDYHDVTLCFNRCYLMIIII